MNLSDDFNSFLSEAAALRYKVFWLNFFEKKFMGVGETRGRNYILSKYIEKDDGVLFVERSGESRAQARLRSKASEPKGNQVLKGRKVCVRGPETGWPIHEQVEVTVKGNGGPNTHLLKKVEMTCG